MKNFIINYFLPVPKQINLNPIEKLYKEKQSTFLISILFIVFLVIIGITLTKAMIFSEFDEYAPGAFAFSGVILLLAFVHKMIDRFKLCAGITTGLIFCYLSYRIYVDNGFHSNFLFFFMIFPVCSCFLFEKLYRYLSFFTLIAVTLIFFWPQVDNSSIPILREIYFKLIIILSGITATFTSIEFLLEQKELFLDHISSIEKKKAIDELIKMYHHEISNPMTKAKGNLERFEDERNEKTLVKVKDALSEMEENINKISTFKSSLKGDWSSLKHENVIIRTTGKNHGR